MKDHRYVTESKPFKDLVKNRWIISILMTLLIISVYFGFILLIAFKKELLAAKIGSKLTLGIPVGIGIIVLSWILTGVYVFWANRYYDKWISNIKDHYFKKITK